MSILIRYPLLLSTVGVGIAGGVLWLAGVDQVARWMFIVFCVITMVIEMRQIVMQIRRRQFGVDILAVIAILATVVVGEVVTSMGPRRYAALATGSTSQPTYPLIVARDFRLWCRRPPRRRLYLRPR